MSEFRAITEPVMLPPSVRPSRRWKSPNMPNTCAPSVERTIWSVKLSASGAAAQRTVLLKLPEELGLTQQQLPPSSDLPSDVWKSWGQRPNWNYVFDFDICLKKVNKDSRPVLFVLFKLHVVSNAFPLKFNFFFFLISKICVHAPWFKYS